jgi:HD superfamily phosphodiesterase
MQCPGQDSRYWDGEAIFENKCPECGHTVEFFKDDTKRKCKNCSHEILNPKLDFGCASYCQYADQCLGSLPPEMLNANQDLIINRVAIEMKRYFDGDFKRIGHAGKVARYAAKISKTEEGNRAVIMISAYLHDIGIKESEKKFNSSAPKYQHQEGPPVAREILVNLKANEGIIDEVCDIISHHHSPRGDDSINFKILYDADLLVNLAEKQEKAPTEPEKLSEIIEKSFLTISGKKVAKDILT